MLVSKKWRANVWSVSVVQRKQAVSERNMTVVTLSCFALMTFLAPRDFA